MPASESRPDRSARIAEARPARVVFGAQPWILGVLNVTPDSFSDGGRFDAADAAVRRGRRLVADGAHLVDVGGESTRPGAARVNAAVQRARVVPVIAALTAEGVACSVDTTSAEVAAAAVAAGAVLVNDVSGGRADPGMAGTVAELGVPWVLMHWRGPSETMNSLARYRDVTAEVVDELSEQVDRALAAGVREDALVLDPGIGFAKRAGHNWTVLAALPALVALGLPVLLGASRKRFLGELLADADGTPRGVGDRETATAAVSLLAAQAGVWGLRVHEPRPTADALAVLAASAGAGRTPAADPAGGVSGEPVAGPARSADGAPVPAGPATVAAAVPPVTGIGPVTGAGSTFPPPRTGRWSGRRG